MMVEEDELLLFWLTFLLLAEAVVVVISLPGEVLEKFLLGDTMGSWALNSCDKCLRHGKSMLLFSEFKFSAADDDALAGGMEGLPFDDSFSRNLL